MKCFNAVLDVVISYKESSDTNRKIYGDLNIVHIILKFIENRNFPGYDISSSICNYKVNLFLALFVYTDFENQNGFPLSISRNDEVKGNDISNCNVSSLAYKCITKLVFLINQINSDYMLNGDKKMVESIIQLFNIKKHSISSNQINYLDNVKNEIYFNCFREGGVLRREILSFILITIENQPAFFNYFLKDPNKTQKLGNFFNLFERLINENPTDLNSIGKLVLIISVLFNNENLYFGLINEFIEKYSNGFCKFLLFAMEKFSSGSK